MTSVLPFTFNALMNPWALLLLIGVAAVLVAEIAARMPGAIDLPTGETVAQIRGRRAYLRRHIPALLRALG
ncbi:MAG: hypothetical protein NTU83_03250, partial [Candidatus Hydrogenedentes bacterium]|nr:hypothetical protein [Candidatus Hydrogenedentota bacterium]